ncbi:DUF6502 family protein [Lentisalinibacter salinarum]|uniref:DUF6502 family protein n=1 Tax=Lentisalinibacter salinarum TaxID=2992239 RepID=UPI00386D18B3
MDEYRRVLIDACRRLLRPIARIMLRGGMTWREFADISKSVFVQVATSDYGIGGRPTNVSRTSILTGLTRREVKRQRELLADQLDESLTRKTNNATRVLARWHQDPDFSDGQGNARELEYEEGNNSFTELLRRYAGDIPPKAMLKELLTTGAVEQAAGGRLRALHRYYMPAATDTETLRRAGEVLEDVGRTVNHNLGRAQDEPSRFEGRATALQVPRSAIPELQALLEDKGEEFLYMIDDWLAEQERQAGREETDTVRLGIGVYFIQGPQTREESDE